MEAKEKPRTRRYSVLPARAFQDDALFVTTLRVLGALCLHANGAGVAWPSRMTLGRHVSRSTKTIDRQLRVLRERGYIRKLEYKRYPPFIRPRNARGLTTRWLILYDGAATETPSREQIYSPTPKVVAEVDAAATSGAVADKSRGARGVDSQLVKRAIGSFAAGVSAATGQTRLLDPQLGAASKLVEAGYTPEQIREYTIAACLDAIQRQKSAPATLQQVATWAGLL